MTDKKRALEMGISFWIGVGLMSLINIWKMSQGNNTALNYSWIMLSASVIIIVIGFIYLVLMGKKQKVRRRN